MHPILFSIGDIHIHSYGVMLAIGFMVGISLAVREARRLGVDPEKILNLTFYILFSSIAGSRIFHCIVYYEQFLQDPIRIFKLWEGGLVFYGGFLAALVVAIVYCAVNRISFWLVSDIMIPSVSFGLMFGRIGCFLAGCCFGKACDSGFPLAITFTNPLGLGVKNVPVYPTQVISAVNALLIFFLLWGLRKKKTFDGMLLGVFLFIYSITRSLIELFRADPRGFVEFAGMHISESQLVSIAMMLWALFIFAFLRKKSPSRPALAQGD